VLFVTEAKIRPARLDDARALHRHCYPEADFDAVRDYLAWCLRQSEKGRDRGRIVRLVAEIEGQAVGNVQLTVWGETGEIGSLVVGASFRRRGLARKLLSSAIDQARQLGLAAVELEVAEGQPNVVAFYQRHGFQVVDAQKRLSHSASPAFVLLRKLL
jgi:ribosomal protein S18 acetylase RimI-like enzyme